MDPNNPTNSQDTSGATPPVAPTTPPADSTPPATDSPSPTPAASTPPAKSSSKMLVLVGTVAVLVLGVAAYFLLMG